MAKRAGKSSHQPPGLTLPGGKVPALRHGSGNADFGRLGDIDPQRTRFSPRPRMTAICSSDAMRKLDSGKG